MNSKENLVTPESDYYIYTPGILSRDLFLSPTITGFFKYEAGYELYREAFDSFLVMYIKKGKCKVRIGEDTYNATEGQIVLIDCYEPHYYGSKYGWEALWLHFDGALARKYYEVITKENGNLITLKSNYHFEKYLDKIYTAFKTGASVNDAVLNKWIVNILTELIVSGVKPKSTELSGETIEELVSYINDHLSEELSIEVLAEKANISPFHFLRVFKKETGFTPHDYIVTARISHAKYLLSTTAMSSKDICFQLGFGSESAFCSTFKRKTHMTPQEFRETKHKNL